MLFKKIISTIVLLSFFNLGYSQIDINSVMGLPSVAQSVIDAASTETFSTGSIIYNTTDNSIYTYNGTQWVRNSGTDDQNTDEVNTIVSASDLNGDGNVDGNDIIDTDGDGAAETNMQDVLEAITPITSKAGRVFYPPSIEIDASTIGSKPDIDLYAQYTAQYGATIPVNQRSNGAPDNIPVYTAAELYYYVTYADPSVFTINSISATGILSYDIIGIPDNDNTLINVVFVVK